MAITKEQLIIDRCLRLTAFTKDANGKRDTAKFMLPEVEDFEVAIEVANQTDVTDSTGATVAQLERGKTATFSGNASFVNFGLMAAQAGKDMIVGSASAKVTTPFFEELVADTGEATLTNAAVGTAGAEVGAIYELNADGSLGAKYAQSSAASATSFAYDAETKKISLPTGMADGTKIVVWYDYESETTIEIDNDGDKFAGVYAIQADILCKDICNQNLETVVTITSDNAKLNSAYSQTWTSESKHPFEFTVTPNVCDTNKNLMKTYIITD